MINKKIISILTICILSIVVLNINITKSNAQSESVLFEETIIKKFGGNSQDFCYKVIKDCNDYIALIVFDSAEINGHINKGGYDSLIVKLDSNLNILKEKSFGGEYNDYIYDIIKINTGYIAIGSSSSTSITGNISLKEESWIMRLDKEFNVINQATIGGTGNDRFKSIVEVDDGYIAIGETNSPSIDGLNSNGGNDVLIVKFDYDLNVINKTVFGGDKTETFHQNVMTTKNGILFTFSILLSSSVIGLPTTNIDNRVDNIIVEIDKDLNILNKKRFGGNHDDSIYSMIETEKGYMFIGNTYSTDIEGVNNPTQYTNFIMELDKNFNMIKVKNISGNYIEGEKLVKFKDGYTVLGMGYDDDTYEAGLYLLNFDNEFNLINENFHKEDRSYFIGFMPTNNEYICFGYNSESLKAIIKKVKYLYKNTQSVNLEIVADNSLELSVSTNKISFEGYNGVEDLNNDKLNLTVSSGLYYDLYATLDSEIRGTNDTNAIIDKSNLKIKTSDDLDYKAFTNIGEKVNLIANHKNGKDFVHNINLKLLKDSSVKADTYNTKITFEVVQK